MVGSGAAVVRRVITGRYGPRAVLATGFPVIDGLTGPKFHRVSTSDRFPR
jgi:hypothetical protein